MKKLYFLFTVFLSLLLVSACAERKQQTDGQTQDSAEEAVEISLWTFPVGNWGSSSAVASLITGFQRVYPDIHVSVECLTYEDGDEKIEQAIAEGRSPDLVFEGPERLVAGWGDQGLMADVSDLWESDKAEMVYENIEEACRHTDGAYYVVPVCMNAHCMAINYDMFQAAGALQYIDEASHTWSTEGFIQAVHALTDYGQKCAGAVYCKNQSGDQGTRALVNNLYGGAFTDKAHTMYTIDSRENIKALELLDELEGITFAPSLSSGEAIEGFCKKEAAMVFCWSAAIEIAQTVSDPEIDFDIFPMAFPTESGQPRLQGGIWGFGIFDNGSEEKIAAAKTFIRYMTENDAQYARAVLTSSHWPVREMEDIYENDLLMTEYSIFLPYVGDYYQITPGWTQTRTAWWKMLQKIEGGTSVKKAVKEFSKTVQNS